VWARVPTLSYDEGVRLVIGEIFATLNVRAMLPGMRAAVRDWRPDVIVREPAEFASAVVAEEMGVSHVEVGVTLAASYLEMMSIAAEAVEAWGAGLMANIADTPYLTLFPATVDDPALPAPRPLHRFRDAAGADAPVRALPDWWNGDDRPLVYVTFGSVTANVPTAVPIYDIAMEAVADLPARVLLTTGATDGSPLSAAPASHVHVARWVPQVDVLAHARAVVCHGGSGTTLGALAAGVPLVVTPLFADQPQNGRRIAAVGAGINVEPGETGAIRSAIDPAALHDAIARVLADETFTRTARAIAAEIGALPPADAALSVLGAAA
jgi:UDP-N-acetylglucosamine transferase subunit ALG13